MSVSYPVELGRRGLGDHGSVPAQRGPLDQSVQTLLLPVLNVADEGSNVARFSLIESGSKPVALNR